MVKRTKQAPRARAAMLALAATAAIAAPAAAQTHAATPAPAAAAEPKSPPMGDFGWSLTPAEAASLLAEMRSLTVEALAQSRRAAQAESVDGVKAAAETVLRAVWGLPSGMDEKSADLRSHGWKEIWQVTGGEFDPKFAERYGTRAPTITDPRELGIAGRGRAVRGRLDRLLRTGSPAEAERAAAEQTMASLNNVIGWTHLTTGFKGREVQPRISLTHLWDAPSEFWNSSADTGWLFEAYAQAANILKVDYAGDVAEARKHAAAMAELLERVLAGTDADGDQAVEPVMMEGGLNAALQHAGRAGLRAN